MHYLLIVGGTPPPTQPGAHTMSISEASLRLSDSYDRALRTSRDRFDVAGIRRAFRKAIKALSAGDVAPAVLLAYRYP